MLRMLCLAGFLGVLQILEGHRRHLEVDDPRLPGGKLLAVFVADVDHAHQRAAHGAGVGEPLVRGAVRETVELRAGVVLVEDRPPPVQHLALHFLGNGRGGMDRHLVGTEVEAASVRFGQFQHASEHGGHPLTVGDLMVLDGLQCMDGVEPWHHDRRTAEGLYDLAETQRGGMVKRGGGEVDGVLVDSPHHVEQANRFTGFGDRRLGQRPHDSLGSARRAGTVEHESAGGFLGEGFGGVGGDGVLEVLETIDGAVDHQVGLAVGCVRGDLACDIGDALGGDENRRLGVVHDVAGFFGGEVAVHGGEVEAGAKRRPHHVEVGEVVLHEDADVIAAPQPPVPEELREPVRTVVQLAERTRRSGTRVDCRSLVRENRRPMSWIHRSVPSDQIGRRGYQRGTAGGNWDIARDRGLAA